MPIAAALAAQGAQVTLVTGPTELADPAGVTVKHVITAEENAGGVRGRRFRSM